MAKKRSKTAPKGPKTARIRRAEFARRIGVSRKAVTEAVQSGRLTLGRDKLLDPVEAAREWEENAGGLPPAPPPPPRPARPGASQEGGNRLSLVTAQTAKAAAEAHLKRLQLERLEGRLVNRADAAREVFAWFRQERDAWIAWPSRAASRLVHKLAQHGVQVDLRLMTRILDEEVHDHLSELGRIDPPQFDPA